MNKAFLDITYQNGKPLAAYYYLGNGQGRKSKQCRELEKGLVVDYAADGTPIGIEIVDPNHLTLAAMNRVLAQLGLPKVTQKDLEPLEAA